MTGTQPQAGGVLVAHSAALRKIVAASVFWSAAGSEAPRRFGFCSVPERGATIAIRCRSKAPSPLRYAGALQRSAGLRPAASLLAIQRINETAPSPAIDVLRLTEPRS